jgi:hypothetical protein
MLFVVNTSNLDEEDDESEDEDDDQDDGYDSFEGFDHHFSTMTKASQSNQCYKSSCFSCHQPMAGFCQPSVQKKKNDKQTKDFIYGMLFEDMTKLKCGCKEFQGKCLLDAGIGHVGVLRERFWGSRNAETVRTKDKGKKLEVLLRTFYDSPSDKFRYSIGEVKVCDRAFFMLLGLIHKPSQRLSRQLLRVLNTIRGKIPVKPEADEAERKLKKDRDPRSKRSRHAVRL